MTEIKSEETLTDCAKNPREMTFKEAQRERRENRERSSYPKNSLPKIRKGVGKVAIKTAFARLDPEGDTD